jgi:hypothetical protein
VANPAAPDPISTLSTPGYALGIDVADQYAYIANDYYGLRIVDVSNPISPTEAGAYVLPGFGSVKDVAVADHYAYLASGLNGLRVIDVSNPISPTEVAALGMSDAESIAIYGHYAYVVNAADGLSVVDILTPTAPAIVGSYDVNPGNAYHVVANGEYVFIGNWNDGLRIVDVHDPVHPITAGSFTGEYMTGVGSVGNYALVSQQSSGLAVLWFAPPETASISPAGGVLTSTLDQTTYTFPAGTFTTTADITHIAQLPSSLPPTGDLLNIGHAFHITTTAEPAAEQSYTVAVKYDDWQKGPVLENTLALYWWNGSAWIKEPTSTIDADHNLVKATPKHMSLWAVLGQTYQNHVYLPLIKKN